MTTLLEPLSEEARELLRVVAGDHAPKGTWSVWQYVLLELDGKGLDGYEVLRGLPIWQHHYRPIWTTSGAVR